MVSKFVLALGVLSIVGPTTIFAANPNEIVRQSPLMEAGGIYGWYPILTECPDDAIVKNKIMCRNQKSLIMYKLCCPEKGTVKFGKLSGDHPCRVQNLPIKPVGCGHWIIEGLVLGS